MFYMWGDPFGKPIGMKDDRSIDSFLRNPIFHHIVRVVIAMKVVLFFMTVRMRPFDAMLDQYVV